MSATQSQPHDVTSLVCKPFELVAVIPVAVIAHLNLYQGMTLCKPITVYMLKLVQLLSLVLPEVLVYPVGQSAFALLCRAKQPLHGVSTACRRGRKTLVMHQA